MKNQPFKILIDNSGFTNRGDQLMIQAVVEQIRHNQPDAQILVRRTAFEQNPSYCLQNKLYPCELKNSGIKRSKLYVRIVNTLLRDNWINTPRDVDVILDCRGYHLADWRIKNQDYVDALKKYYSQFCKKGRKIILLPQAFGPFENPYSRQAMEIVYEQADYIYAREIVSFKYLQQVCPSTEKLDIAPDFTCVIEEKRQRSILLPPKQYMLIIPNAKMIEQGKNVAHSKYIDFLVQLSQFLREKGENVYLLNHEGEQDEELLRQVNKLFTDPFPILSNLSGMEIRAIIAEAKMLISGRFHGLVSGLTQDVPTLCTAWSHKYLELLKEHNCEQNILDVNDIEISLQKVQNALETPKEYSSFNGCNEHVRSQIYQMWNSIFARIK